MLPDELPNPVLTQDKYNTVTQKSENARDATKRLNEVSEQYRTHMLAINEKVIFLSAGSISLLLTFIGILFNSDRDVSQLNYIFVIFAVTSWLLAIIFLLVSRWNLALYIFSIVHGHYLSALEEKTDAEIDLYKIYPNIVDPKTLKALSKAERDKMVKEGESTFKLIKDQSKQTKNKEELHNKLNKAFNVSGHVLFVIGYIFAFLFFTGVLALMKN